MVSKIVEALTNVLLALAFIVLVVLGVILLAGGAAIILGLLGGMLFLFIGWWAVGGKIKVTSNDVKIGHVRWFTYYPLHGSPVSIRELF